jgi:hypothetical protein
MKNPFKRDIPPGAAAVIVALTLLASVVTGGERLNTPATTEPAGKPVAGAKEDMDFDPSKLDRQRKEREIQDLFASPAPPVVAAAPIAQPPPRPAAPPLPFRYLGRLADGAKVLVFLERNHESLSVPAGETIDGLYRVESIADSSIEFVYLPLGTRQMLHVPAPN